MGDRAADRERMSGALAPARQSDRHCDAIALSIEVYDQIADFDLNVFGQGVAPSHQRGRPGMTAMLERRCPTAFPGLPVVSDQHC
jgi:hypothetical protein